MIAGTVHSVYIHCTVDMCGNVECILGASPLLKICIL